MNLQHKVQISIADGKGKRPVLKSGIRKIPHRLLRFLFGEFTEVLVLSPGQSVKSVEIHEVARGGVQDE